MNFKKTISYIADSKLKEIEKRIVSATKEGGRRVTYRFANTQFNHDYIIPYITHHLRQRGYYIDFNDVLIYYTLIARF